MTLRQGTALIAMTAAIFWATTAFAQGPPRGHHDDWAILRSVGLTDAQRAQVRQIMTAHQTQMRTLRHQLHATEGQLKDKLYSAGTVAASDLAPLTQQIDQMRGQLAQE